MSRRASSDRHPPRVPWAVPYPTLVRFAFSGSDDAAPVTRGALGMVAAADGHPVAQARGATVLEIPPPESVAYRVTAEVKLGAPGRPATLAAAGLALGVVADADDLAVVRVGASDAAEMSDSPRPSPAPQQVLRLWPDVAAWARNPDERAALAREFDGSPGWRDHWLRLALDIAPDEVRAWLDGRLILASQPRPPADAGHLSITLNEGDQIRLLEILPLPERHFVPLDLAAYLNNDALAGGDLGDGHAFAEDALCGEGMITVCGVPFQVCWQPGRPNNVDLGMTGFRGMLPYVRTDAMSGDPQRLLLRVPKRYYDRAHLICVSDTTPGSLPAAAVRMIKCGRGHAISGEFDVLRWSDPAPLGEPERRNDQPAGASLETGAGRLWQISVPLNPAEFQEFLAAEDEAYLELDLTRLIGLSSEKFPRPMGPPSAVHLFALTLEAAPAEMVVTSDAIGHVFQRPHVPTMKVQLRSQRDVPQGFGLELEVTYPYGATFVHQRRLSLAPRASETVAFELQDVHGKFDLCARLTDASGERILERRTTCALLPSHRRRATADSPFGMWCFFEGHLGAGPEVGGHLMALAGVRWTIAGFVFRDDPDRSAARADTLARCGIGLNGALLCGIANTGWDGPGDVEAGIAKLRAQPHSDTFHVFWETYLSRRMLETFPPELLDRPPLELTDEERRHFDACWETGLVYSRRAREEFPGVNLLFGGGFPAFIGSMLRAGYPKDYLDGLALDFDLFTAPPERQPGVLYAPFNGLHYLKRFQEMYGYEEIPRYLTEAIYAPTAPGWLTEREQAEHYVRAHVLGLAAGVKRFCMATEIWDPGSEFGYGHYGPVGLCRRPPELNPRDSFCAYATMTAMLDQAQYDGMIPAGSPSVFVVRFRRADGRAIYVLWTLRGRREAVLHLAAPAEASITDLFANTHTRRSENDRLSVALSGSPVYVEGIGEILGIQLGEPQHDPPADASSWRSLAGFESLDGWAQESDRHEALERLSAYAPLAAGGIEVEAVRDERGPLLRVAVAERNPAHPLQTLYTALRRDGEPLPIPEETQAIGAWVYGNSCGGRVFFEVTDAQGRRWLAGRAETFVDFDGCRLLEVTLPHPARGRQVEPTGFEAWVCDERGADPAYPLTLTRLILESRSHVIRAADLEPVPQRAYFVEHIALR